MKLHLHTFDLVLKHTFRISHAARTSQPTLIVELNDGTYSGLGEATATSYYGLQLEQMVQQLEALRPLIEATPLETPEQYWEALAPYLSQHPFLQCAVDIAAHDLFAQRNKMPLYQLWELSLEQIPISNYTIGIGSIEEMITKIAAQPWPIYKIKLGTDQDMAIIKALRNETNAIFRVDANTAWTDTQTISYAPVLQEYGVEFIEQPLPPNQRKAMKTVYQQSSLPIIADESCQVESDVEKCAHYFHGINIKLMKCGGLTPAKRMIHKAKALNMKVMVGCMTESSVGISAIAHLLPLLDYVDMDGPLLLKKDIATGVTVTPEGVIFPERNGTGAQLIEKKHA